MKRFYKWIAVPVVLATLAAGSMGQAPAPAAPAPAQPQTFKLAVVNIVSLFDALHEKTAADDVIDKLSKSLQQEYTKRQEEVKALSDEMDHPTFAIGSPEYEKNQDDLLRKTREVQAFPQYRNDKISIEMNGRTAALYTKINQAVADYAKAHGIAMVFVGDQPDLKQAVSQGTLPQVIGTRKLLYFVPEMDITNDLIRKMNVDYDLGAGKTAP